MIRNAFLAVASTFAIAASAQALTITSSPLDVAPAAGEQVVFDFNVGSVPAAGNSYTGGQIFAASVDGIAAAPAGDTTPFFAVQGGQSATFTFAKELKSFSVYIGSVDAYNSLRFVGTGYDSGELAGSALPGSANGNQTAGDTNRRYFFTFAPGESVKSVTFASSSNSLELDNIATAGVPEPATWALLMVGFGMVGASVRRRNRAVSVAA